LYEQKEKNPPKKYFKKNISLFTRPVTRPRAKKIAEKENERLRRHKISDTDHCRVDSRERLLKGGTPAEVGIPAIDGMPATAQQQQYVRQLPAKVVN
jgi:hypothetical protein